MMWFAGRNSVWIMFWHPRTIINSVFTLDFTKIFSIWGGGRSTSLLLWHFISGFSSLYLWFSWNVHCCPICRRVPITFLLLLFWFLHQVMRIKSWTNFAFSQIMCHDFHSQWVSSWISIGIQLDFQWISSILMINHLSSCHISCTFSVFVLVLLLVGPLL